MDSKDLEKALSGSESQDGDSQQSKQPAMSKEMEIGFHQGALNTLVNERSELIKMAQVTEKLMQVHMKRLEELGVRVGFGEGKK